MVGPKMRMVHRKDLEASVVVLAIDLEKEKNKCLFPTSVMFGEEWQQPM